MTFKTLALLALLLLQLPLTYNAQASQQALEEFDVLINTPGGFTKADNFNGFIQPETFTTIKASETITGYEATLSTFIRNTRAIEHSQHVKISDREGQLIKSTKQMNGNDFDQLTLIFGDKISTVTLTATYPKHLSEKLTPKLKKSLLSTRWLRLPSQQMFKGLPFVFDESANLEIIKRTGNSLILLDKTPYDTSKNVTPLLIISAITGETEISDIKEFSKNKLKIRQLREEVIITSEKAVNVNGIKAYQITAKATDKKTGRAVTVFQTIAYQRLRYLLVQGLVEDQQADHIVPQFQQVVDSLKFKK